MTAAIEKAMLAKLSESALDISDCNKLGMHPVTASGALDMGAPVGASGFVIPYFDLNGKPSTFWRLRYLEDTRKGFDKLSGRKALRYVQPSGGVSGVYLPPYMDWAALAEDTELPLVITEGELKAACACKHGFATVGLGGVWSFKAAKAGVDLLPMLEAFAWSGRQVTICYDSDAVTNPQVLAAESALADVLTARGAVVYIARLPHSASKKCGLDDAIVGLGVGTVAEILNAATAYAASEALHEMNSEVVYVKNPGLIYAYTNGMKMRCEAFTSHAYSNRHYFEEVPAKDGVRRVKRQTAKMWLEWGSRAELDGIVFEPGKPKVYNRNVNTWDGWAVEPSAGDVQPWHELLMHLFPGEANDFARTWFEQWCAYPLQNPGQKLMTAAVMWGVQQGTGKTLVGHTLMRIYGKYSAEIKDSDIDSPRNEWAESKQFVLADDVTGKDNRRFGRRLMTMVTQKEVRIDPKYIPSYSTRDCINYYFTSNEPDCFYLDDCDRRFFIHEVRSPRMFDAFRRKYIGWMESAEGVPALFDYLLNLDLTGFEPSAEAPQTSSKKDMQQIGKSDLGAWVAELRTDPDRVLRLKGDLFTAAELLSMYDPNITGRVTANGMARELRRSGFRSPSTGSMAITEHGNVRLYAIRNVAQWDDASMLRVVEHYNATRTVLSAKGRKF